MESLQSPIHSNQFTFNLPVSPQVRQLLSQTISNPETDCFNGSCANHCHPRFGNVQISKEKTFENVLMQENATDGTVYLVPMGVASQGFQAPQTVVVSSIDMRSSSMIKMPNPTIPEARLPNHMVNSASEIGPSSHMLQINRNAHANIPFSSRGIQATPNKINIFPYHFPSHPTIPQVQPKHLPSNPTLPPTTIHSAFFKNHLESSLESPIKQKFPNISALLTTTPSSHEDSLPKACVQKEIDALFKSWVDLMKKQDDEKDLSKLIFMDKFQAYPDAGQDIRFGNEQVKVS